MVNEVLYCERLMALEWVQGEFDDNFFTVDGRAVHKRADHAAGKLQPPADGLEGKLEALPGDSPTAPRTDAADDSSPSEATPYVARSVWLSSERLGLTAKVDVIEGDGCTAIPIEYKRGHAPDNAESAHLPERAQVCAQVLLLRAHGYKCDHGEIYFAADRRRVTIEITEQLVATTLFAISRARELGKREELPPVLIDSPKCSGCSLVGICLPDEVSALHELAPMIEDAAATDVPLPEQETIPDDQDLDSSGDSKTGGTNLAVAMPAPGRETRRLHPARDDRIPLYVQTQGAYLCLDGEELVVRNREGSTRARIPNLSQVSLFGNIQVTTPAFRTLFERGIPVSFFSYGGWFIGRAIGLDSKNVFLRTRQYRAGGQKELCLRIARGLVVSKILNCRTLLRRNATSVTGSVLGELKQLARKAAEADSLPTLLGIEGSAARSYFGSFPAMLSESALAHGFDLDGRNRRPPKDPVNALLSFVYGMLTKEFTIALTHVGLDPLLGFYHQPRHGRPALALDLLEEFRPLVGDSVVVGAINTGVVRMNDFIRSPVGVALTASARRRVIEAYERRMDQLVTHPVFGYRISYRRVIEVQCRLLTRFLFGEIPTYPAFRTR